MDNTSNKLDIQDFIVIKTIGSGTYGRVKLAKLKGNSKMRPFAMKAIRKSLILKYNELDHLISEKDILCSIRHPFFPRFFCTFQDDQFIYFLFKYICGGELFNLLRKNKRFIPDHIRFYGSQIFLALEYLHSQSIVFRDLKPENILIDKKGYLRLTDFGYAKRTKDRVFTMCGTPEYMAPEVIMKANGYSFEADWWSFGVLLYEMAEGTTPFYDKNPINIYKNILSGKFEFKYSLDLDLQDLIKGLLRSEEKRTGRKYESEIKGSRFFKKVAWEDLLLKKIRAPWVPFVENCEDTRYFNYGEQDCLDEVSLVESNDEFDNF